MNDERKIHMIREPLTKTYPAIFHPEEKGGYFIDFPDIQGAYTGINETNLSYGIAMTQEVLGMVLADYLENGEKLPIPTPIKQIPIDEQAFTTLISVNVADYLKDKELVKKTLSIPIWADKLGKRMGINFSVLLTEAISQQVDEWLTPHAKK